MTLRTRLLLALAGSGLAILLTGFVAREIAVRYASEASIESSIEARMGSLERETCENQRDFEFRSRRSEPSDRGPHSTDSVDGGFRRFPRGGGLSGGPRMTHVFFYDPDFKPRTPSGPRFPEEARARLRSGETFVNGRDHGAFFGALATSWAGGPCTYALAVMPTPPPMAALWSLIMGALLLIGAPALVLWFAMAQPVARIRALAAGVREAASKRYETSVSVTGQDEIAELGRAFNDASAVVRTHVAEVERREKALRDFVAHTTHDVALPLSVLLSHVSSLGQQASGSESSQTIGAIAQETQYIASLLANLEAVARLESDTELHERHPVDLSALVERVAVRHLGVASTTGVDFNHSRPEAEVWVTGDVTLIEQAVNNLVHNAVQYNQSGGHVALVLEVLGNRFILRVSDDGPGVAEHDIARLGESRFRSQEARSRRPNGMGLGLSIARDVARRHAFTLTMANRVEGGFEAVLDGEIRSEESKKMSASS